MEPSSLILRLTTLRRTIRRRLLAYGLCVVAAGGVASFLTVVAFDWFLGFPPLLRVMVAGLFLAGLVGATRHWIIQPLRAPIRLADVAACLEARWGTFNDQLLSTVDFLEREQNDAGSGSMMRRVIDHTERIIQDVPLESALSLKPLVIRGGVMVFSVATFLGILLMAPAWAHTGLHRYLEPWGGIDWPRSVLIQPLTGDRTVAVGESVTIRMAVRRGLNDTLRGVVHLREPDGRVTVLAMQRGDDETFHATLDAMTTDLAYWFEAGDDTTRPTPHTLHVVRRPEVVEVLATVEPPPYAANQAVRVQDVNDGPVPAPVGGHIQIALRASKPIRTTSTESTVGLRTETGAWIPLTVDTSDATKLSTRFEVVHDVHFHVELQDEHGFENRGASIYSILATPDQPPTVTIVEPTSFTELTPQGTVTLLIRVEDDFGIARLDVESTVVGDDKIQTIPLTDRLEVVRKDDGLEGSAIYEWRIEPLSLRPGDVLLYKAVARDNDATGDGAGQVSRRINDDGSMVKN